MASRGRVKVERGAKRVRAFLGGETVLDTTEPLLVWEKPYYPTYYIPQGDIVPDVLVENGETERSPSRGTAVGYDLKLGRAEASNAAYAYPDSPIEELQGHVAVRWDAMDQWFEEDEEVFVHPRDPYTRVDVLRSSRHVRIELDGTTVAESTRPTLLFETGLPVRYYLPKTDVRFELLTATDHQTECPYKGTARYWTVTVDGREHENLVWGYDFPVQESIGIAGLVCFYDERVDVFVDGELQQRPRTPFS